MIGDFVLICKIWEDIGINCNGEHLRGVFTSNVYALMLCKYCCSIDSLYALGAWYRGQSLVWDATVLDTLLGATAKDSAGQAGTAATEAEAAKRRIYNDLLNNYHFQPVAIETTGVNGKSTAPFCATSQRNLSIYHVTPGSNSGSASACPWLWSEDTLPAYWFVRRLNLIFVVPSVLLSDTAPHLPLLQCIAIAFRMFRAFCKFCCPFVQCCFDLDNRIAYDDTTALCYVPLRLKLSLHNNHIWISGWVTKGESYIPEIEIGFCL